MAWGSPERRDPIARWDAWIQELERGPLDQYEYLGALEHRDELEVWLNTSGDRAAADAVDGIDARFRELTYEDERFAEHFSAQAGSGWWWNRMPADPASQRCIVEDWG